MANNFETRMLVNETKGLFEGLENYIGRTRVNLAFDNLDKVPEKITEMRMIIDRIEAKVMECELSTAEEEDELVFLG